MQIGDVVRLRYPFRPEAYLNRGYRYGVVVGIVRAEEPSPSADSAVPNLAPVLEVVVQLYDLERAEIYRDLAGIQPLYSFYAGELDGVVDMEES